MLLGGYKMSSKKLLVPLLALLLFFSFDVVKAQNSLNPSNEDSEKITLAAEKRKIIREHQKANEKLETLIEKKSKKIEKILIELPNNTLIPDEVLQNQLDGKMDFIMNHLMQIGDVELSAWDNLNSGNRLINNKKYDAGLKKLDKSISNLERKHELLNHFITELDELLAFLNSIQNK
jgi:hypothetical protein